MTATDPPTGGDAVRRRTTAPLPGTAAPAAQGPGSEAGATIYPPGVIPDGAEQPAPDPDPGPIRDLRRPGPGRARPRPAAEPGEEIDNRATSCPNRPQHMNPDACKT